MLRTATTSAAAAAALLVVAAPAGAHEVHPLLAGRPWAATLGPLLVGGVLLVATVALAGLLVAPLVVGPSPSPGWVRATEGWLAALAAVCDLAVLAGAGGLVGALGGWPRWLAAAHLGPVLVVLAGGRRNRWASVALATALAATLAVAGPPAPLGWGRVVEVGARASHVGAAAVWVGGVAYLALGWRRIPEGRAWLASATRRFGPTGAVAALTTLGTGVWNMAVHEAWADNAVSSAYGRVLVAKTALLVPAVVAAGALVRRWADPARRRLRALAKVVTAEAATFVVVVALASALLALPSPADGREPGVDLLRRVRLGERSITVSVTPQRPGENLVQVLGADPATVSLRLGGTDVALEHDGSGGSRAVVRLPPARSTLRLSAGAATAPVVVDTGRPRTGGVTVAATLVAGGPHRAECASRHLGRQVAVAEANSARGRRFHLLTSLRDTGRASASLDPCGGTTPPPSPAALEPTPAQAASAFVRFLSAQGVGRLLVVVDASPRGREFADHARAAAGVAGVAAEITGPEITTGPEVAVPDPGRPPSPSPDAVVVATGWDQAGPVLDAIIRRPPTPARGVYLTPWLLKPDLLEAGLEPHSAQVSVGASLAPTSAPASAYLTALRRLAPGAVPSGPGMVGYLEARRATATTPARRRQLDRWLSPAPASTGGTRSPEGDDRAGAETSRVQLFTPVRLSFLPEGLDPGHGHDDGPAWIPGVTLAPVGAASSAAPPAKAAAATGSR